MATFSGGGRTREPGEIFYKRLKDATSLDDSGYVLRAVEESSEQKVDKCGSTDIPYAVNYRSTRDPHNLNEPSSNYTYLTGTNVGDKGIPVFREGWAKLILAFDNAAIAVGDPLVCTGSGKVDKYTPAALDTTTSAAVAASVETRFNDLGRIVGHAEEKVASAGTTGSAKQLKILTKLSIRSIGLIT